MAVVPKDFLAKMLIPVNVNFYGDGKPTLALVLIAED
jgi:hypothetical protein